MTCEDRQQWRVLLEDRDGSWFWPEEPGRSSSRSLMRLVVFQTCLIFPSILFL